MNITKAFLMKKYIEEKLNQYQIAELCDSSQSTIRRLMKKYNIKARPYGHHLTLKNAPSKKYLLQKYTIEENTQQQIANELKCSRLTIRGYLIKYNIKIRKPSESNYKIKRISKILTENFLINEYTKNKKICTQIAKENNISQSTIRDYLIKYNIAIRPGSYYTTGNKNPCYKGKILVKCASCGQKIEIFPSQAKNFKCHFCNLKCYAKYKILNLRGKNNGNYIDGRKSLTESLRTFYYYREWRTEVFKRDNYTCQECGLRGGYIEAHHKTTHFAEILSEFLKIYDQFSPIEDKETLIRLAMKYKPFWEIENGQTLCRDCHNLTKGVNNDSI